MRSIVFRDATQADVAALARLYVEVYALLPWNEPHDVAATEAWLGPHIRPAFVHTRVAVEDEATGRVVGLVIVSQYSREQLTAAFEASSDRPPDGWPEVNGRLGFVWELIVHPQYQRRGIGLALMSQALERMRRDGADRVLLRTSERGAAGVALYQRLGFAPLPVREREDPRAGMWALALNPDRTYADLDDPPTHEPLAWVWATVWRRLNGGTGDDRVRSAFAELAEMYDSPGRRYHTLTHVRECVIELYWTARAGHTIPSAELVSLALFFHDCVYDSHRTDNEARSADLAADVTRALGLPAQDVETVRRLILATDHVAAPDALADPAAPLTLDVDLAILGRPAVDFDHYESAIRREYAHVPDGAYRAGRTAVLRTFLGRPRIYATDAFFNRYEARARANLMRSLARLS